MQFKSILPFLVIALHAGNVFAQAGRDDHPKAVDTAKSDSPVLEAPGAKGISCNCPDATNINGECFCNGQGRKIFGCIRQIAPNWPLDKAPGNPDICPSAPANPEGHKECIEKQVPQPLPNAKEIADGCIKSVGAKASPPSGLSSRLFRF